MRDQATSVPGNRTRIRYKVELLYDVLAPTDFIFNVHAARTPQQRVLEESVALAPDVPFAVEEEPATCNRLLRTRAEPGTFRACYEGRVEVEHHMRDPARIAGAPIGDLPASVLRYLWPSRYCQTDHVQAMAWREFGHLAPGFAQAQAVTLWVRERIRFQVGTSSVSTSALDTFKQGAGVCRDFAHLTIALLRSLNYPTRFVTGVDYGADPSLGPPDFHSYAEAFIGGRWWLFDATGISPLTGLIRIGTGRDAADVAFATMFGSVRSGMPLVSFVAEEDPAAGVTLPWHPELAVSTAAA
ncbi:MAG TPA: transglutaminase family protein [Casimicrobiaceae bacterium]